jgi:transposase-like protein
MQTLDNIKSDAINAVKVEQRLIADVALEYGISKRKLYSWLNEKHSNHALNLTSKKTTSISRASMKLQIKTLLKSELHQYLITERLVDGKIILEFIKRGSKNIHLRQVS